MQNLNSLPAAISNLLNLDCIKYVTKRLNEQDGNTYFFTVFYSGHLAGRQLLNFMVNDDFGIIQVKPAFGEEGEALIEIQFSALLPE